MKPVPPRLRLPTAALLAAAALFSLAACEAGGAAPPTSTQAKELRIAVPAYVNPPDTAYWQSLIKAVPKVRDVIINPDSGPGTAVSQPYVQLVKTLRDAGIEVLGYVSTQYGARDPALVNGEIARWREWYGVDDIFFDEAPADAAGVSAYSAYAATVHDGGGLVVLNPGLMPDRAYFEFADAIVTFESPVSGYFTTKEPPEWLRSQTRTEVWHIVSGAPQNRLAEVVDRAREHGVDHIYVTDDAEPNPYDTLPSYWAGKLDVIGG
jgi:hypothetical protein